MAPAARRAAAFSCGQTAGESIRTSRGQFTCGTKERRRTRPLTLSLLCRVAAAFSLVESPVVGRRVGFGDEVRGGGDEWRAGDDDERRPPGWVELEPRGDDAADDVGNGALPGGGPAGGW